MSSGGTGTAAAEPSGGPPPPPTTTESDGSQPSLGQAPEQQQQPGERGEPASAESAPAAPAATPAVGATVELCDLVKTAVRNGERGVVAAYASDGRAEVRLDAGDTVRVSAAKVRAVAEPYRPAARYLQAKEHVHRGMKLAEDKK